jgi:4-amino-4-deoxy-L-arabinose transferase-like glycosyltransferase
MRLLREHGVLVVVAVQAAVLLAMAPFYGPHRDELYFAAAGDRLAWGYPDQPWLTPLLARISTEVAGHELVALRLWPLVTMVAVTLVAARMARLLGGTPTAQTLTAAATAFGGVTMANGHRLSTASIDTLVWAAVLVVVTEALMTDRPRLWLLAGLIAGVGLSNKSGVVVLVATVLVSAATTPVGRRHLATPWPWAGGVLAAVMWLPNLVWQARHDWPQLTLAEDIQSEYGGLGGRVDLVLQAVLMYSPVLAVLWVGGIVALLRRPAWRPARPVALVFLLTLGTYLVVGGKGYYLAGAIVPLLAAGFVALTERWPGRDGVVTGTVLALTPIVAWPALVPVLPVSTYADSPWRGIDDDQAETVGWPSYVGQVRAVLGDLSPTERENAVVLTTNYGEAGALEWYHLDVPVHSGHNGYADWGPPPDGAAPVVAVGQEAAAHLTGCTLADRIVDRVGVDNDEAGVGIWVCDGPDGPWEEIWPEVERLSA